LFKKTVHYKLRFLIAQTYFEKIIFPNMEAIWVGFNLYRNSIVWRRSEATVMLHSPAKRIGRWGKRVEGILAG